MSPHALQRLVVRMMYDPAFLAFVYADPEAATQGTGVSNVERGWLTAADPRAFGTDTQRRSRTLTALLGEFPASATAAVAHGSQPGSLEVFFASAAFHESIQSGQPLALAFGAHLAGIARQRRNATAAAVDGALVGLELAVAQARRARPQSRPAPPASPPASAAAADANVPLWQLAPNCSVLELPAGTALLQGELAAAVRATPLPIGDAIVSVAARWTRWAVLAEGASEWLLALSPPTLPDPEDGITLERMTAELGALLRAASAPVARGELSACAQAQGAAPDEVDAILDGLIADGLLVAVTS